MARPKKKKTDDLKLLGIWLPPEERWQIKQAAAAHRMTLNQAVRQAMQEWIARSQPATTSTPDSAAASAPTQVSSATDGSPAQISASQPGAKTRRGAGSAEVEARDRAAVLEYAAKVLRTAANASAGKPSGSRSRPATTPAARPQASPQRSAATSAERPQPPTPSARPQAAAPTRKAESPPKTAAPARGKAPFAWLRGAAGLDWAACPAVESHTAPDGARVWVFRGTRITLKKVFRLLQEGHRTAKVGKRFNLNPDVFREVLRFAAQRLAPDLPGAQ
jgi:hypothetical protein